MLKSVQIIKKGRCFTLFKVVKSAHVKNNTNACILLNRLFLLNYVYKNDKKINIYII